MNLQHLSYESLLLIVLGHLLSCGMGAVVLWGLDLGRLKSHDKSDTHDMWSKDLWPWLLCLGLAIFLGMGISAIVAWLRLQWSVIYDLPILVVDTAVLLLLLASALVLRKRRRGMKAASEQVHSAERMPGLHRREQEYIEELVLSVGFMLVYFWATIPFLINLLRRPWGEWDAIMIWTVRARFIYRSGTHWADTFTLPAIHPDYPLFIPLSIERLWVHGGWDMVVAPVLVCISFFAAGMLIFWGTLRANRDIYMAVFGGAMMIANPFMVNFGSSQLADVPLALTFMSGWAMVLLACREKTPVSQRMPLWVLAGVMFGLTLWTKNEGMMMILASSVGLFIAFWPEVRKCFDASMRREAMAKIIRIKLAFMAGFLPFAIVWLWAKLSLIASNDLIRAQQNSPIFDKLIDPSRHALIFKGVWLHLGGSGPLGLTVLLLMLVILLGYSGKVAGISRHVLTGMLTTIVLCMAGYYVVYLLSPFDLAWHLETSLNRLSTHFWPAFVLWVMVGLGKPQWIWKLHPCSSKPSAE